MNFAFDFKGRTALVTGGVSGIGGADAVFSGTATFQALTAGVPEPGAWALMIVGFAGTGALLRRRRADPRGVDRLVRCSAASSGWRAKLMSVGCACGMTRS